MRDIFITQRKQNKEYDTRIVVFFFDECGFKSHPISKFVEDAKEYIKESGGFEKFAEWGLY